MTQRSCREQCCCNLLIARKHNIGAIWSKTLRKCGKCPPKINIHKNNSIAPSSSQNSKVMTNSLLITTNSTTGGGSGWRKVNWRKYLLERQTAASLAARNCPGAGNGLTPEEVQGMSSDDPRLPPIPVTCKNLGILFKLDGCHSGNIFPPCPPKKI